MAMWVVLSLYVEAQNAGSEQYGSGSFLLIGRSECGAHG